MVPVLFLVFNRPKKTQQVFSRIAEYRPSKIYIAADGPRDYIETDKHNCKLVREIVSQISWDCEVKYLYREKNLGCSTAIVQAIDWFFSFEESGVILEDDCLPELTFFDYCENLLDYYRDNNRIMHISGTNLGQQFGTESYYFSKYGQIWGWATWKRSWLLFEKSLNKTDRINFASKKEKKFWTKNFNDIIWDVQWAVYSIWLNNGISVLPNVNLVTNIGFDTEGTNYKDERSINSKIQTQQIQFPLTHPKEISINKEQDAKIFDTHYFQSISKRIYNRITSLFK